MSSEGNLTFIKRKNTLCVDLKSALGLTKPKPDEWADWLVDKLEVKPENILLCHVHTVTGHLMVTLADEEDFKVRLTMLERDVAWGEDKVVYGWSSQDYLTTVKVHNYAPHMDLDLIKKMMGSYGKVISCVVGKHRRFKNALDGTLTFRMKFEAGQKPPSVLKSDIEGEVLCCYFEGRQKVCYKCGQTGHIGQYCRQILAQSQGQSGAGSSTWAGMVAGSPKPVNNRRKKATPVEKPATPGSTDEDDSEDIPCGQPDKTDKRTRSPSLVSDEETHVQKTARADSDQTESDKSQSPKLVPSSTWGTQKIRSKLNISSESDAKSREGDESALSKSLFPEQ